MPQVEIHLVIHFGPDDLHVDFPFDTQTDNIDDVVSELVSQLSQQNGEPFPAEAIPQIKQNIESQISKSTANVSSSPSNVEPILTPSTSLHLLQSDSSDDDIDDPEYKSLIAQQEQEMQALLAHHLQEKKKLAADLKDQAMQAAQLLPTQNSIVTPNVNQNQSPPQTTNDDLIVF